MKITKKNIYHALGCIGVTGVGRRSHDLTLMRCGDFYIRALKEEMGGYWVIQFGISKYFDRWSNSVNFVQKIPINNKYPIFLDLSAAMRQARKVVRSGAFNWNSYFDPIMLDAGYRFYK